ncbi:MAG TPA: alpha/beta hydrolase [Desulfobulbaceae bacterium]|nr:alpha/beta hydrolase [Desulfobulbaceae bacterium]
MTLSPPLAQYPFAPVSVTVAGNHRISCVEEGQGMPVVMLHGNPSWSYLYRRLILGLRGNYRCLAPDHLGCGLSDKPQHYPYRLTDHIANLEQVLAQRGIGRCVLVVHDWGGAIGMGWAVRNLDRVAGLVVMNTAAFRSTRIPLRIAVCRWPLLGAFLVRSLNLFARGAIYMAVAKRMAPEVAAGFLAPYDSWANRVALHRFVQDIPLQPGHPSWPTLVQIEAGLEHLSGKPMLICWGGMDFCFNDVFYQEWRRRFPKAQCHYYPAAGHYLLEDAFPEIMRRVGDFLLSLESSA